MNKEEQKSAKNTFMLFVMTGAKMLFPLMTLPYLTRVLTTDAYGLVSYVKAVMQYAQLFLMFGFTLSATKDIVYAQSDKKKIGQITGDVIIAKLILALTFVPVLFVVIGIAPLLRSHVLFVLLSFVNIVMTEMLVDFLFRGIDRMEIITKRFILSKTVSTVFTFLLVKGDSDILLIPILDLVGTGLALLLVARSLQKLQIPISRTNIGNSIRQLKESAIFFVSEMATTAFGAFNTVVIGALMSSTDVAYWSLVMQLIAAVQSLYAPISNGIYPSMLRTKSLHLLFKVTLIFMPIVVIGCLICVFGSDIIISTIAGTKYLPAAHVFRLLVPVLFFSFPSMIYGWPALGPIEKQKETSLTTILTALFQVVGIGLLILFGEFTLTSIAILRGLTELLLLMLRLGVCWHFRDLFA